MGKEQHHTGNTNTLLLTCPHASNFKSFLYALPAGHSETQRSDPGFKAFIVQCYMVLSQVMHQCFRGKKKALVKASNAQEHSTSQPTAAQRVGQCWNSHPTHHHLLPISPMSSKLQRSRSCKNTHSNLLTPRALEAPQQTGNTGGPETEMPPALALLGADRIHVVRKGVSQPLHPPSPPVQKQ